MLLNTNLAKELKGSFVYESKYLDNKYVKRIPDIYRILVTKGSTTIAFDMTPSLQDNLRNTKDVIPCIIDFYLKKEQISLFEQAYSRSSMVLISSKEAFDYLRTNEPLSSLANTSSHSYTRSQLGQV